MSRGKKREIRKIKPDPRYKSELIAKFIRVIMKDGKKEVAEKIVYKALSSVSGKLEKKYKTVCIGFREVILMVGPTVQTKTRRIGGTNYQVPVEISEYDRISKGMRILKEAAYGKKGIGMAEALSREISDAMDEKGEAYKKKMEIHKQAQANKAYSHLA